MPKHTPRPWEAIHDHDKNYIEADALKDDYVAYVPAEREVDIEEAKANARLIAAAPDLLEACQLGDFIGNNGPTLLEHAAALVEAFAPITAKELRRKAKAEMAAIRKATGEETDHA